MFVMRRSIVSVVAALATVTFAGNLMAGVPVEIVVAPKVINLDSKGVVVTVHTDIAYSNVDADTVTLTLTSPEGGSIDIAWWKADSRANFVAKFNLDEVKSLIDNIVSEDGDITLRLSGKTTGGEDFSGTDEEIPVIGVGE
jgi:hypothetical protein